MKRSKITFIIVVIVASVCLAGQNATAGTVAKVADGLSAPVGMAFDGDGFLYIANWSGGTIDRWHPDGTREVYIGGLPSPSGLAIDKQGMLYIATYSGGKILRVDKDKKQEVFVSGLSVVAGIGFDQKGNLLAAERGKSRVISISPKGEVSVLVDKGLQTPAAAVQLTESIYVINDLAGTVFSFDAKSGTLKPISRELNSPAAGLVLDPNDENAVFTVDYGGTGIYRIDLGGNTVVVTPRLESPVGLAMDSNGNLYAATWSDNALYRIEP